MAFPRRKKVPPKFWWDFFRLEKRSRKFWRAFFRPEKPSRKFWWDFRRRKKPPQNFGGTSAAGKSFPKILAGLPPPEKVSPKFWRDFRRRKKPPQNFGGTSAAGNNPTKTCVAAVLEAEFPPVWWAARRDGSPHHSVVKVLETTGTTCKNNFERGARANSPALITTLLEIDIIVSFLVGLWARAS